MYQIKNGDKRQMESKEKKWIDVDNHVVDKKTAPVQEHR